MKKPRYICASMLDSMYYDYINDVNIFRKISRLFFTPRYSATYLMRLNTYCYWKRRKALKLFYHIIHLLAYRLNHILNGIEVSVYADIAPGILLYHTNGTVIGGDTKLGKNVTIHGGTVLGLKNGKFPTLKDNVYCFGNACIVGDVTIEENSIVAPNSVVVHSMDKNSVVSGIPAKKIK